MHGVFMLKLPCNFFPSERIGKLLVGLYDRHWPYAFFVVLHKALCRHRLIASTRPQTNILYRVDCLKACLQALLRWSMNHHFFGVSLSSLQKILFASCPNFTLCMNNFVVPGTICAYWHLLILSLFYSAPQVKQAF